MKKKINLDNIDNFKSSFKQEFISIPEFIKSNPQFDKYLKNMRYEKFYDNLNSNQCFFKAI